MILILIDQRLRIGLRTTANTGDVLKDAIWGGKLYTISSNQERLDFIEDAATSELRTVSESLSTRECYYYDSFFGYTDHTTRIYNISQIDGVLREIAENADSGDTAQNIFNNYCSDNQLSYFYAASEDLPAPLIGNLGNSPRPRLVHCEDDNHIYVEFWKRGNIINRFDIDSGEYQSVNTVSRPYIRIHLDSGLVEAAGDRAHQSNKKLVSLFLKKFSGNSLNDSVNIGDRGIKTTRQKLAFQISLDEFKTDEVRI